MLNQPIAVLGGGNNAHAMAADLSLAGFKINFYEHPQFGDAFKTTLEKGVVEITERRYSDITKPRITGRHGVAQIHKVTTDMKAAISDVKLIFVVIPSYGQELFFNTMIPYLQDGQVVFLMSGNSGSLRLHKLLREKVSDRKITIYECNTVPYGARLTAPASVEVKFGHGPWLGTESIKTVPMRPHVISALPAKDTDVALSEFHRLYPLFSPVKNVLVAALNNFNPIGHVSGLVMNAGRVEYANLYAKCDFYFMRESHTPSVQRVEAAISDEAAAMVRALGGKTTLPGTMYRDWFEFAQTHYTSLGPRTLEYRYITEDVPYGLVPRLQLGEKLGVATPVTNALIEITSVISQEDYRKTGRTLESLGLAELSKKQIIKLVEVGSY